MIVADASAVVEVLLHRPGSQAIGLVLLRHRELHVPEHFHAEVLSALRRFSLRGELPDDRAQVALRALHDLRAIRYPVVEMAAPIWALRENLTAYDAAYLALARSLRSELITLDSGLAAAARADGRLAQLSLN